MNYKLIDARTNIELYIATFIEYCNVLSLDDHSIKEYDYKELALENIRSNLDHPFLIIVEDNVAGLVVFSDEENIASDSACHTYINEIYVKDKFRNNYIASKIVLDYLKQIKYDTGFCYVIGSKAEIFWKHLLNKNGYDYRIFKEDNIRDFVHIYINKKIDITKISTKYDVRYLQVEDANIILDLMNGNPFYFECVPPFPNCKTIIEDMYALPPNKNYSDKYYVGFFKEEKLIAVLDLITDYPKEDIAFIGFFMLNSDFHNKGISTNIINELVNFLSCREFKEIRLGYAEKNIIAKCFWKKLSFVETGEVSHQDLYDVIIMKKDISRH